MNSEVNTIIDNIAKNKELFLKSTSFIFSFSILGLVCIVTIPIIDKALFSGSKIPSLITFIGIPLTISLLMIAAMYFVIRNTINIFGQFFLFAVFYNILVIFVKFSLSPIAIYKNTQNLKYEVIPFFSIFQQTGFVNPLILPLVVVLIFYLYLGVFRFIYFKFRKKIKQDLNLNENNFDMEALSLKLIKNDKEIRISPLFIWLLLLLIIIMTGGFSVIDFFYRFLISLILVGGYGYIIPSALFEYFTYIFPYLFGLIIPLTLVVAIYFLVKTFKTIEKQVLVLRDISILVTFFWIGSAFLIAYHALWLVYLIILSSLWPVRVYMSSMK